MDKHGNSGNKNAKKDRTKESTLFVRCSTSDKAGWVKKANADGVKLSEWVINKLNSTKE